MSEVFRQTWWLVLVVASIVIRVLILPFDVLAWPLRQLEKWIDLHLTYTDFGGW